jgi:hypothetical protein
MICIPSSSTWKHTWRKDPSTAQENSDLRQEINRISSKAAVLFPDADIDGIAEGPCQNTLLDC